MALRDDLRKGKGSDEALNRRLVEALDPGSPQPGRAPDLTGSWDALFAFVEKLPGVRYRLGHDRLGETPPGETLQFVCAITTHHGTVRHPPVRREDLPGDTDNRRVFLEAILIAQGF